MNTKSNPEVFRDSLLAGTYQPPISAVGLAKTDVNDKEVLLFSLGGDCRSWLRIPPRYIEKIDHLGTVTCGEHTHHQVRFTFKNPDPDNEQALLLGELLRSYMVVEPIQALFYQQQFPTAPDYSHAAFLRAILDYFRDVYGPTYYGGGQRPTPLGRSIADVSVENRLTGQRGEGGIVGRGNCRDLLRRALERACREAGCDPEDSNSYTLISESCERLE